MCRRYVAVSLAVALSVVVACSRDPQVAKREYVDSGDKLSAEGKLTEASIQYRNAVALDNADGEARFKLAETYEKLNDPKNALREYIRAADLMPDNVVAQVRAGNGLLLAGMYPEARARAAAVLAKEPKNVNALVILGNAMAGMKDMDNAIATAEQAVDADPTEILAYTNLGVLQLAKGDRANAEQAFKRATEVAPESESARLALANFYWASGRMPEAEQQLQEAVKKNPKSLLANRAMAVFYATAGRPADTEKYLKIYADLSSDPGPKLGLADFLILRNRNAEAAAVLQPLLDTERGWMPAKLRLAAMDFTAGKRTQAYATVDELLTRDANNEVALLEKARFLMADKKPGEALTIADRVLTRDPNSAPAHYIKGVALRATGTIDEAIAALEETAKLSPTDAAPLLQLAMAHYARGDNDAAVQFANQVLKMQPRGGQAHLVLAKALIRQNNLKAAEPQVRGLLSASSENVAVQVTAGDYGWAKKDYVSARKAYEKALALDEQSIEAATGLIRIDLTEKKPEAVRARLESIAQKFPDDERVLSLAGKAYMDLRDPVRAEAAYRRILQVNPASFQAYAALGGIYVAQRRLDEAIKEYEEAARISPKAAPAALTMVGSILTLQGKGDAARSYYQRALALDPQMPIAANNLAWDYAERDQDLDVALNLAQMAKAKLPDSAITNDTLGWVYYKKGLGGLAVSSLDLAAQLAPTDPGIQYRRGMAHLLNGDREKARRSLEQALSLGTTFKEQDDAKRVLATLHG